MGSHKKNKAPSHHQRKNSLSSPSSHSQHHLTYDVQAEEADDDYDDDDEVLDNFAARNLDFSQVLQEVEGSLVGTMTGSVIAITGLVSNPSSAGNSFRVSWREMVFLLLVTAFLAGLSIFMGVAAGITISIHYFDAQELATIPGMEFPSKRVTTIDPAIVSTNIIHPSGDSLDAREPQLTLGRVMTVSESGQPDVLLVVEETAPMNAQEVKDTYWHSDSPGEKGQDDSEVLLGGRYKPYRLKGPPNVKLSASKVHPTICSDGITIGFSDWDNFSAAIKEINALSAEQFMKWNEYFASLPDDVPISDWYSYHNKHRESWADDGDEDLLYYYDEDIVFTICPGTMLKAKGPIVINSPNIVIECGDPEEYEYLHAAEGSAVASIGASSKDMPACGLDGGGSSHLSFGSHARNVLVRGIMFQSAKTSSLVFHYAGAQASFEDCVWTDNTSVHGKRGAVADVNTTSYVNFYRCEIGTTVASRSSGSARIGVNNDFSQEHTAAYGGLAPGFASFLSLRT